MGANVRLQEDGKLFNPATGYMAGSSATILACANHLARLGLAGLNELGQMCFYNPLRLIGISPKQIRAPEEDCFRRQRTPRLPGVNSIGPSACVQVRLQTEFRSLNMRTLILQFVCAASLILSISNRGYSQSDLKLWYTEPAKEWTQALPIGNGRLGAMVFGGTAEARYQLNEDSLWCGKPHDYAHDGAAEYLPQIRQLLFEGKQKEAEQLAMEHFMSVPLGQMPYQPFGDLKLTFPGHDKVEGYRRELDLDTAIATTTYRVNGVDLHATGLRQFSGPGDRHQTGVRSAGASSFTADADQPQPGRADASRRRRHAGNPRPGAGLQGEERLRVPASWPSKAAAA